jgi:hypothetical protein
VKVCSIHTAVRSATNLQSIGLNFTAVKASYLAAKEDILSNKCYRKQKRYITPNIIAGACVGAGLRVALLCGPLK